MYPISDYVYNLYMRQHRQVVDITMQTQDGIIHITDNDIIQGNLTIDRYCMSGKTVEVGSAVAAELKMLLNNKDGRFDGVTFEGAELFVRVGIKKWDANRWENAQAEYVPCGYFTIDEPPRKLASISISALDRMVSFDKDFDLSAIHFPLTVSELLTKCCQICNVPMYTHANTLLNYNYIITSPPDPENLTYRQIIQWIGEITGTCAYIDWDGKLRMEWYHDTPTTISGSVRYTSDFYEDDIAITGVQVADADKNIHLSGAEGYVLNITGNGLIQHDHQLIAASLYKSIGGLKYRAYSCTTKSMPHVYPLDKIVYVDKDGVSHNTIVTHYTFKLNGKTAISARGQTAAKAGYAAANPLTKREAAILEAMKRDTNKQLESRQQAMLEMNEVISNSLGLYVTGAGQENGSTIYYYHNGATLENSNIIYTFREGGFAWTDVWSGEDTVWQYGLTKDGNAILNMLHAYKIGTEYLEAGCVTAEKIATEYVESVNNRLELVVKTTGSGNTINTAGIVTAINNSASSVQIRADKIYLNGVTLANAITAGSIVTGALSVQNLAGDSLIYANTQLGYVSIAGFSLGRTASKGYISYQKTSYNNNTAGIYLGTDGIGLGKGNFYVTSDGNLYAINAYVKGTVTSSEIIGGSILQESGNKIVRIQNYVESKNTTTGDSSILDNGKFYLKINNNNYMSIAYNQSCAYAQSWIQAHLGGIGIAAKWETLNNLTYITQGLYVTTNSGHLEGTWFNDSGGLVTSDIKAKHDILPLDDRYIRLFDGLLPCTYQYNNGTSGRRHTGFVVQDILSEMQKCGIDTQDFAAVAHDTENDRWALRYDELIALCVAKIQQMDQKLKKIIKERDV